MKEEGRGRRRRGSVEKYISIEDGLDGLVGWVQWIGAHRFKREN